MKKFSFLLAAFMLLGIAGLQAQDYKMIEKNAKEKTDQMAEELDLTEEQQTLLYRQNYTMATQKAKLKAADASDKKVKKNMEMAQKRYVSSVKDILKQDQVEDFMEMMKEEGMLNEGMKKGDKQRKEKMEKEKMK